MVAIIPTPPTSDCRLAGGAHPRALARTQERWRCGAGGSTRFRTSPCWPAAAGMDRLQFTLPTTGSAARAFRQQHGKLIGLFEPLGADVCELPLDGLPPAARHCRLLAGVAGDGGDGILPACFRIPIRAPMIRKRAPPDPRSAAARSAIRPHHADHSGATGMMNCCSSCAGRISARAGWALAGTSDLPVAAVAERGPAAMNASPDPRTAAPVVLRRAYTFAAGGGAGSGLTCAACGNCARQEGQVLLVRLSYGPPVWSLPAGGGAARRPG